MDFTTYLVVSVWFGCNNACRICMLGDLKPHLRGIELAEFRRLLAEVRAAGRHENLILSGAQVTTFEDLERYVACAVAAGGFKRIQIQTNGRRLADAAYTTRLVRAGVNEFFVSVQGLEPTHDGITGRPGSFRETLAGLRNLADHEVNVITNTVLTRANAADLPALLNRLAAERVSELHLWNFFPMERTDSHSLVVSLAEFTHLLPAILDAVRPSGKPLVLKSFPECLPLEPPGVFDSLFPATLLPGRFWQQFAESGFGTCRHRPPCSRAACWGLSRAYVERYGDERGRLTPQSVGPEALR